MPFIFAETIMEDESSLYALMNFQTTLVLLPPYEFLKVELVTIRAENGTEKRSIYYRILVGIIT